mgnify:FL=1
MNYQKKKFNKISKIIMVFHMILLSLNLISFVTNDPKKLLINYYVLLFIQFSWIAFNYQCWIGLYEKKIYNTYIFEERKLTDIYTIQNYNDASVIPKKMKVPKEKLYKSVDFIIVSTIILLTWKLKKIKIGIIWAVGYLFFFMNLIKD